MIAQHHQQQERIHGTVVFLRHNSIVARSGCEMLVAVESSRSYRLRQSLGQDKNTDM